jgi:hypothetical protein
MGTCNNCGKFGYMKSDCWTLDANKIKDSNEYRGTTKQVTVDVITTDNNEIEYVLCGINNDIAADDFVFVDAEVLLYTMNLGDMYDDMIISEPKKVDEEIFLAVTNFTSSMKMLSNPNIWSGDTVASVHTSPCDYGVIPVATGGTSETVTVGNGKREKTVQYGMITGTVSDKHGSRVGCAKLQHAVHSPKMKFNLCSLSRLIQDGWNLKGSSELNWVEKNEMKLKFDIKITTASCVVYCMYIQYSDIRSLLTLLCCAV